MMLAASVVSCASPGAPPGGPEDRKAPVILKVTPDTGTVKLKAKSIVVAFDEVISERPRGGNDLSAVLLLSPSDGPARIAWNRTAVAIRPRKGFRPNTAYSLTILPGLADLRGNVTTRPRQFVFSTGPTIPRGVVRGAVFDWITNKPVPLAAVDAVTGGDTTLRWVARSDSAGRYTLPYLPGGAFRLRVLIDQNSNGKLDPREAWDSITVNVTDSVRVDLYAFAHDTVGARVVGADVKDSTSLRLTFDKPLANTPPLTLGQVVVKRADSSVVALKELVRASAFDSLMRARADAAKDSALRADTSAAGRRAVARADSAREVARLDSIERARVETRRAARDTVVKVPPPVPARQAIATEYVAIFAAPVPPGNYRVAVHDAKSVSGVIRSSERTFTRAKPEPPKVKDDGKTPPGAKRPTPSATDSARKVPTPAKPGPGKP